MFHECLGVVNAVPGEQGVCLGCLGVCLGCLGVVFYCLGVFWGLLEGVSVLSEVSGSAFYSNLIYINCALIKSLTFSKRRGGPRCLKYQNVPTSRSFWPIGNPWERFQSWDIRVYFIPVPKDHTVILSLFSFWDLISCTIFWISHFYFLRCLCLCSTGSAHLVSSASLTTRLAATWDWWTRWGEKTEKEMWNWLLLQLLTKISYKSAAGFAMGAQSHRRLWRGPWQSDHPGE